MVLFVYCGIHEFMECKCVKATDDYHCPICGQDKGRAAYFCTKCFMDMDKFGNFVALREKYYKDGKLRFV